MSKILIALFILCIAAFAWAGLSQPWTIPDDPPETYTPVPQFAPGGVGQPPPPFDVPTLQAPEAFTPTKLDELPVKVITIKLCFIFNITLDKCLRASN